MTAPHQVRRAPLRTVRPKDLAGTYTNPRAVIAHHLGTGALIRLAPGYVMAVPDDKGPTWRPTPEAAGAGVATAIHGPDHIVLMGLTAARVHGALPRALGCVVIAVPRQHRPITLLNGGTLQFVQRDTDALDASLQSLDVGRALVTTVEQTTLDLVRRPMLGGHPDEARAAVHSLLPRLDQERLHRLATTQHGMGTALGRIKALL